ncbi:MAG: HGGxSTG domain-containing protein [Pseudomonadota bacterium]|nr:HGGxSTG domain-containing protein [Pseudomonadota bacterium]
MLTKDNVTIGIEWRFGPDWPGQRCGAKTRRGTACQRPANKKNGRCRLHGGASSGAKTEEGRARISAANLRHGKFTKEGQQQIWQPWILILCEGRLRSSAWESDDEDQKEQHERSSTCRCDCKTIPETLPTPWKHKLLFQNVNRLETVT